jgi:predicted nucleic acid-binding protein
MASYLLDTNVVLRLIDRADPAHPLCQQAVEHLILRGDEPCLAPQVLVEFWVVATRPPDQNGLGWASDMAGNQIGHLRAHFSLLPEKPETFEKWLHLVTTASVLGKRAHDARLAAFMQVHALTAVLTLNPADFNGLGVTVVEPGRLISGGAA